MTLLARGRHWQKAHPLALDAALAAGVLICMITASFVEPRGHTGPYFGRAPAAPSLILMVAGAATLVFRRRRPLVVLAMTVAVTVAELFTGEPRAPVVMSAVVALYTVAATTDRPTTWRVGLLTGALLTGIAMVTGYPLPWYAQDNLGIFAWTGMASAAGDAVRSRRAFIDAMTERAERAERTREEEARRRVAEERLRIARDLHDVVAHHIALVNVQAGVASHVMDKRPDQAKEALAHVREASRSALDELRATVGLLRQSGDPEAPTEPAPGLARLDELAESFQRAGLPVEVARSDDGVNPPAAVDLVAYRVIQEALTNVQKHAGPGARAEVSVVRVGARLEITVLDDGPGHSGATAGGTRPGPADAAEGHPDGGGHGLLGMRERVTALGGSCTTGPRYGGGFRVHAILPLAGATGDGRREPGARTTTGTAAAAGPTGENT
ncbi:Sensor histidine kinase DesK [Streptomyces sp. YIM 130001]|uniref:sensor histidine kinase n=1 Tax=Streptomyces sp. YIM 130001 TaxID=2259644 RepID=UPI000EBE0375|nr:histidine kinase [Streptomyces sp. YIM 130001]RII17151.1 Sensor histidine kinase DesK [Streptomyces sp. YIM 130001]